MFHLHFSVSEEALMDFDSLIACQSGLGTGAVIVMNKQVRPILMIILHFNISCELAMWILICFNFSLGKSVLIIPKERNWYWWCVMCSGDSSNHYYNQCEQLRWFVHSFCFSLVIVNWFPSLKRILSFLSQCKCQLCHFWWPAAFLHDKLVNLWRIRVEEWH